MEGELSNDIDMLNPSLTDLQLHGRKSDNQTKLTIPGIFVLGDKIFSFEWFIRICQCIII